jgi:hypothetical protein
MQLRNQSWLTEKGSAQPEVMYLELLSEKVSDLEGGLLNN